MSLFFIASSDDNPTRTPAQDPVTGDQFVVTLAGSVFLNPGTQQLIPIRGTSWNSSPNISVFRANNQVEYTSTVAAPLGVQTLTIPDGLYSVSNLQDEITNQMIALGHGTLLVPIFELVPLIATSKIQWVVSALGFSVDFTIANSIRDVVGFTSVVIGPPAAVPETFTGGNRADFPQGVTSHVIHITLVTGSYIGGTAGSAAMKLPLSNTSPNRQLSVVNTTRYALAFNATGVSEYAVFLTDQAGRRISLNGNTYSVEFAIEDRPASAMAIGAAVAAASRL